MLTAFCVEARQKVAGEIGSNPKRHKLGGANCESAQSKS